jgi:hypothetical protein
MSAARPESSPRTDNSPSTPPSSGGKPSTGLAQVALILGVVALLLGGSALGIALTKTGATGGVGPAGSRGPAGPDAELNHSAYELTQEVSNDTCTAATGSEIGFTVAGPGNVTIVAAVSVLLEHTSGDSIHYELTVQNAALNCDAFSNNWVSGLVDYSAPTTNYAQQVTLADTFPLTTAGTYSFEVVGNFTSFFGLDIGNFNQISVLGEFYPS